jgi:hypothetical protein
MLERDGGGSDNPSDVTGDTTLAKRVVVVSSVSEKAGGSVGLLSAQDDQRIEKSETLLPEKSIY